MAKAKPKLYTQEQYNEQYSTGKRHGYESGFYDATPGEGTFTIIILIVVVLLLITSFWSYSEGEKANAKVWTDCVIKDRKAEYVLNRKTGETDLTWIPRSHTLRERVTAYGN